MKIKVSKSGTQSELWYNTADETLQSRPSERTPTGRAGAAARVMGGKRDIGGTMPPGEVLLDRLCRLDPDEGESLSIQLAANLRREIASGALSPGDRLPTIRELAVRCGTSLKVPLRAIALLSTEGLVRAHPRFGCVVAEGTHHPCRGRVLYIHTGYIGDFYRASLFGHLAEQLQSADYRLEQCYVSTGGCGRNLSAVERQMHDQYVLAITTGMDPFLLRRVEASGIPYLVSGTECLSDARNQVGNIDTIDLAALTELVSRCRSAGVEKLLLVGFDYGRRLGRFMRGKGFDVESLEVAPADNTDRLDSFKHMAFDALSARLASGRPVDAVLFLDDYLTRGGLWAIAGAGLRVPDDIRIATYANTGDCPFFSAGLSCIVYDPPAFAAKIASSVLRFLRDGSAIGRIILPLRFVPGQTL